jgi:uncharacterized protein involved in exopolysaccharide biosynthesis
MVSKLQLRDKEGNLIDADKLTQKGPVSAIMATIFPKRTISIAQYQGTDILEINAASAHPEETMMMANTLAEIMVEQNEAELRAEYRSARVFIEAQIQEAKDHYNAALARITDFKKGEKVLDLAIETKLAAQKMGELLKEKEDNIIDLAQARAKLGSLKEQLAEQSPAFLSASTLKENPQIEVLKKRLTELSLELTQATSDLTERHPKVLSLREQIKIAEAELNNEIQVYRRSAPQLTSLQRQVASLEAHLEGINADIEKYGRLFEGLPEKAHQQAGLDLALRTAQGRYSSSLDSLYQVGMAEATTLSEIRVIEPAVMPSSPFSPNKALNTVMGLFMGLFFGLGLALIFEYFDDTIRTAEDVKPFRPIALLGTVPKFKHKRLSLISAKDPNDPVYESYRRIRNHATIDGKLVKSILITSPGPGEGKSTTVVNLGISIAREGKRVLIADLDLRRADLHGGPPQVFRPSQRKGLDRRAPEPDLCG